ncbi:putative FAD-dependent oxygenase [Xylaria telfairii]|nr:putative FAD-dependent oxygenase [Xylaria telfairii]
MFQHYRLYRWLQVEVVAAIVAWGLSAVCQDNLGTQWLDSIYLRNTTGELANRLSPGAQIYPPGSDGFAQATLRWSAFDAPGINLVVAPSVEDDVAEIVKYANEKNIPYIAIAGGHGAIITLSQISDGIGIWMHQLNTIKINEDSAQIGGGALSKTVTHALWAAGKQTVTGGCECTSLLGPGLGGGHGILQGRHGLVSDQFISMNIVLASGDITTIDNTSDLWWAVQGAGHNFGIVTSVTMKIYDVQHPDWAYEMFTFTSDKVEVFYDSLNVHLLNNGSPPVNILNYGFFTNIPEINSKPITMFWILQEGATSVDSVYTKPFHELGPSTTGTGSGIYLDVPRWIGWDSEAAPCQHRGLANTRFPIDIKEYNVQSMREVYDLFADVTHKTPELNGSHFLFEGYPLKGVKAIPGESTAYPFRDDNILVSPVINWVPSGPEIDMKATDFGKSLRKILYEGTGRSELHTYVNYAFGDETRENWYGYEQERQQRLLALKNKYDPHHKFSFYAPIG